MEEMELDVVCHDVGIDVAAVECTALDTRKRSPVWKEFLMIAAKDNKDGKSRAMCKHCMAASFIANSNYGTKNMLNHLKKCKAYLTRPILEGEVREFDQKVYRELVAKAIIKHGYTFSWVEHEGNREIHAYLNNQVKTISKNTAKADCLKMYKSLKAQLMKILQKVPSRISLTSDMWTSCQTEGYMCVTAHYVDENWKLQCRVLSFCHIESPHTGLTMYNALLNLIQHWKIEHKIFCLTLDNASSNDKMQDYLRSALLEDNALLCKGDFFHVRCAAHVLNLIVKDGLKVIEHIVHKIRESVKFVKFSESRKCLFRNAVTQAKLNERKALWLDVPTRWNSTYMMIDRALLYRDAFKKMVLADISRSYRTCPDSNEWDMLEKLRDALEPFAEITDLFSGSTYPTSNLYFENVFKIAMHLKELAKSDNVDLCLMAQEMKSKFDKYWFNTTENNYGMLFAFALVLDPRSKLSTLKYCYKKLYDDETEAICKINQVQMKLKMFLLEYTQASTKTHNSNASSTCNTTNKKTSSAKRKRQFDPFADLDNEEATSNWFSYGRTMLDVYLEDDKMDRNEPLDILKFWKDKEPKYAELSHLARDILTVPLTTVASESTFSVGGKLLSNWKSSYLPENVEALITSRSWMWGFEANDDYGEYIGCDVE